MTKPIEDQPILRRDAVAIASSYLGGGAHELPKGRLRVGDVAAALRLTPGQVWGQMCDLWRASP